MLDVAAHMLLLQRQAQIKHERPRDDSFLPLSLTIACLLRQLPAGLAPPAGILSLHEIDRLPIDTLEQSLVLLLYGDAIDALPVRGSAKLARALAFVRSIVVYVKTTRAMLALCHDHMTDQRTAAETIDALTDVVVATLGVVDDEEEEEMAPREEEQEDEHELLDNDNMRQGDEMHIVGRPPVRKDRPRPKRPLVASATATVPTAVDPSGIIKRAVARDAGDGSAIMSIMKKYRDDARIQTHGVRALKNAIRRLPAEPQNQRPLDDSDEEAQEPTDDPQAEKRRDIVALVLDTMTRYPDHAALQRDGLFCLLEYVSQVDEHVATIASLGGIVAVMESMARLPDDEEAQIAALSVLGHPTLADASVVRVNPESRRLVLSVMRRFPLSERLQGLACLALANLSLRHDESMREIVACGGLELVVAAMTRFSDVSLIQAAGCWLLSTVSSKDAVMLAACLDAGGLPPCEKARVRFATDSRVQQHAALAIQSLVRDVPDANASANVDSAPSPECCVQ